MSYTLNARFYFSNLVAFYWDIVQILIYTSLSSLLIILERLAWLRLESGQSHVAAPATNEREAALVLAEPEPLQSRALPGGRVEVRPWSPCCHQHWQLQTTVTRKHSLLCITLVIKRRGVIVTWSLGVWCLRSSWLIHPGPSLCHCSWLQHAATTAEMY